MADFWIIIWTVYVRSNYCSLPLSIVLNVYVSDPMTFVWVLSFLLSYVASHFQFSFENFIIQKLAGWWYGIDNYRQILFNSLVCGVRVAVYSLLIMSKVVGNLFRFFVDSPLYRRSWGYACLRLQILLWEYCLNWRKFPIAEFEKF